MSPNRDVSADRPARSENTGGNLVHCLCSPSM